MRWHGRLQTETPLLTLAELQLALAALTSLCLGERGDRMSKIVDGVTGAGVGSVGFWTQEWRDEHVYEVGWMVVPEFQGRGIAVAATGFSSLEMAASRTRRPQVDASIPSRAATTSSRCFRS